MAILLEVEPTQGVTSMADPDQDNFATLEKNGLRDLLADAANLLRPQDPSRARPLLWRHPCVPGGRDPARALPELRRREAREAALVGEQPPSTPGGSPSTWAGAVGPRRSGMWLANSASIGRRSRRWKWSTCASNSDGPGHPARR